MSNNLPPEAQQTAIAERMASTPSKKERKPYKFTPERRAAFLREMYANHGNMAKACSIVGITRRHILNLAKKDPEFAAAIAEAREAACDDLESALVERGSEGWEKGVWHKGIQVGTERQFSDTAAMFVLRGRRPDVYARDTRGDTLTVNDNRKVQVVGLSDEQLQALAAKAIDGGKLKEK